MSDTKITIHEAAEGDIEAAAAIGIEAWTPIREGYRLALGDELYEAFFTGWPDSKRASIAKGLRSGRGFVAKDGDRVVGFIYYQFNPDTGVGEICENAVSSAYRGQGIGGMLYSQVFDYLQAQGAKFVKVTTGGDDGHAPARKAYEKAGFHAFLPSVTYYKAL